MNLRRHTQPDVTGQVMSMCANSSNRTHLSKSVHVAIYLDCWWITPSSLYLLDVTVKPGSFVPLKTCDEQTWWQLHFFILKRTNGKVQRKKSNCVQVYRTLCDSDGIHLCEPDYWRPQSHTHFFHVQIVLITVQHHFVLQLKKPQNKRQEINKPTKDPSGGYMSQSFSHCTMEEQVELCSEVAVGSTHTRSHMLMSKVTEPSMQRHMTSLWRFITAAL